MSSPSLISENEINGYFLNKTNRWTYTNKDCEEYNEYKHIQQLKKEQKQKEIQEAHYKSYILNNPNHVKQAFFIGIDMYGFNHYSVINNMGNLIYYYIDKSGLYHYYN